MNLRQFELIEALAEHGSVSAAARWCGISQPAASMQLSNLEEELNIQLVERQRGGVLLTPAGEQILSRAQRVTAAVREVEMLANEWANPYSGSVAIGGFPTLAPYLFPVIMNELVSAYPELIFSLQEQKTDDLLAGLRNGTTDAAFIATPIKDPTLTYETVFSEDFHLLVPKTSHWATRQSVTSAEVPNTELLLLEEGHCLRDQTLGACQHIQTINQTDYRASSLPTLIQMVSIGRGITLVPTSALSSASPNTIAIPISPPTPGRTIALAWRTSSPRKNLYLEIADDVKRLMK